MCYYENILQKTAALWESLSQNHPFIVGNKYIALAIMHTFLIINNYQLTATDNELSNFIEDLYNNNNFDYNHLLDFLEQNTQMI
ncbi:Type II toxin-antitoxin system death-on-curing family toxin [Candidatus Hepatincolaceae symbiont of Richtersius coronifer]